jgi:DinB family protein
MLRKIQAGLFVAMLMMLCTAGAKAQDATPEDKEKALKYLETTKQGVLDSVKGLSEAQWNFKPGPDRWSVAQVMEHIATAEDFIRTMDKDNVMKAPPGDATRDVKKADEGVLMMVPDRSHKIQAPEPLVPANKYGSPEGAIKHFVDSRAETEAFLKDTPGLRAHVSKDTPLGAMDGYEFILLIAAHSERHTKQINEVKADPNFPKN